MRPDGFLGCFDIFLHVGKAGGKSWEIAEQMAAALHGGYEQLGVVSYDLPKQLGVSTAYFPFQVHCSQYINPFGDPQLRAESLASLNSEFPLYCVVVMQ